MQSCISSRLSMTLYSRDTTKSSKKPLARRPSSARGKILKTVIHNIYILFLILSFPRRTKNTLSAVLTSRVLSLQSENVTLQADLSQSQADLSSRVETQRQTYREQLRKLQDDHRTTVETLQGQLTRVEEQLFNLQSQNSKHR